ncbi:MAG: 4-hydroxyproline epimerase [Acidobacteria bacterium]|nr:4-hydroxyproline epimerase [Acidobacteriota bacterium]
MPRRIRVVDSHTGGEPTRIIVSGGPQLGGGTVADRHEAFQRDFDQFRSAVVNEPRGSDAMVGALLCEPSDSSCSVGVIFFNNVGFLNMCGHGTIGLMVTLAHLGRLTPGVHRIETPVGVVSAELHEGGRVTLDNVPSYRHAQGVRIDVPGHGEVAGDIAWGGNWFFLVEGSPAELDLRNLDALTAHTWAIRQAIGREGITGANGGEIDHIELFGPARNPAAHSRNFVLCPGKAYDRSPCGTGTSAKLACLYAAGKLAVGDVWIQESIVGSTFEGRVALDNGRIIPRITGSAYVNAEADLILDDSDPFCWGIRA